MYTGNAQITKQTMLKDYISFKTQYTLNGVQRHTK